MGRKLKVEDYKIKVITSSDGRFIENVILELILEDGSRFRMGGIPIEIAIEIEKYLINSYNRESLDYTDPRYTIYDTLLEFPDIERILRDAVKEVVIDYYDSRYSFYGASIILNEKYTIGKKKIIMIPSHAILLALLANKCVYVDSKLLDRVKYEYFDEEDEYPDDIDLDD